MRGETTPVRDWRRHDVNARLERHRAMELDKQDRQGRDGERNGSSRCGSPSKDVILGGKYKQWQANQVRERLCAIESCAEHATAVSPCSAPSHPSLAAELPSQRHRLRDPV